MVFNINFNITLIYFITRIWRESVVIVFLDVFFLGVQNFFKKR